MPGEITIHYCSCGTELIFTSMTTLRCPSCKKFWKEEFEKWNTGGPIAVPLSEPYLREQPCQK